MNTRRHYPILFLLLMLSLGELPIHAQNMEARLTDAIHHFMTDYEVPGITLYAAVADGGTWHHTVGLANRDTGDALTSNHHFRIGSITKTFTAAAVLRLVDQGRLDLDTPLDTYLPSLLPHGNVITIRQLLSHRSGLHDHLNDITAFTDSLLINPTRAFTPESLIAAGAALGLASEPGTAYRYSNTGYAILGLLLETLTGQTYEEAVQTLVLDPLGLVHTHVALYHDPHPPFAVGYHLSANEWIDFQGVNYSLYFGTASVASTATDLTTFLHSLLDGTLLEPATLEAMMGFQPTGTDGLDYGLGLANFSGFIGHNGLEFGYSSFAGVFPEIGLTLVALGNASHTTVMPLITEVARLFLESISTSIESPETVVYPFTLTANYPNPFNPTTTLTFETSTPMALTLEVFDTQGRRIALLLDDQLLVPGQHEAVFDAHHLPNGVYFARLSGHGHQQTHRMVLLK